MKRSYDDLVKSAQGFYNKAAKDNELCRRRKLVVDCMSCYHFITCHDVSYEKQMKLNLNELIRKRDEQKAREDSAIPEDH